MFFFCLVTPCNEYISGNYYSHNQPLPEPESPPRGGEGRFRRKIAALRDADGRRSSYASRSQSNDHMALLSRGAYMPDELEQIGGKERKNTINKFEFKNQ